MKLRSIILPAALTAAIALPVAAVVLRDALIVLPSRAEAKKLHEAYLVQKVRLDHARAAGLKDMEWWAIERIGDIDRDSMWQFGVPAAELQSYMDEKAIFEILLCR